MCEEVIAQIGLDEARRTEETSVHQEPEDTADERNTEHQRDIESQLLERDATLKIVNRILENPRNQDGDGGCNERTDKSAQDIRQMAMDVGPQTSKR